MWLLGPGYLGLQTRAKQMSAGHPVLVAVTRRHACRWMCVYTHMCSESCLFVRVLPKKHAKHVALIQEWSMSVYCRTKGGKMHKHMRSTMTLLCNKTFLWCLLSLRAFVQRELYFFTSTGGNSVIPQWLCWLYIWVTLPVKSALTIGAFLMIFRQFSNFCL